MKRIQIKYTAILSFLAGIVLLSCSEDNNSEISKGKGKLLLS